MKTKTMNKHLWNFIDYEIVTETFTTKKWGVLGDEKSGFEIGWCSFDCPYCKKYHSNSFLFTFSVGKNSYNGFCKLCKREMIIEISLKLNNKFCEVKLDGRKNIN